MKTFLYILLLISMSSISNAFEIQSSFKGPVNLKVWKHWQPSWNVEVIQQEYKFQLDRLISGNRQKILFSISGDEYKNSHAKVVCTVAHRTNGWNIVDRKFDLSFVSSKTIGIKNQYTWNQKGCLDINHKQIVKSISIEIHKDFNQIWSYTLHPMYVRGRSNAYANNPIDSYMAHAGTGSFSIELLSDLNKSWDVYNNRKISPVLNFIERNTISSDASVGNHRHERNQEMWLVEKGKIEVSHGVSYKQTNNQRVRKVWNANGEIVETDEFQASGGWIETRTLYPGDFTVIAPDPNNNNEVTFNGLKALEEETVFWTMGAKN